MERDVVSEHNVRVGVHRSIFECMYIGLSSHQHTKDRMEKEREMRQLIVSYS